MLILLPSGEQKLVLNNSLVNKGSLSNFSAFYEVIKKAGRNRWLRKRPTTRGVAMNPIDHPHGGGEGKTSAGRPSVSFTGRLTKNVKTSKKKRKYS
jgi:large subunit ribosomal protein L2